MYLRTLFQTTKILQQLALGFQDNIPHAKSRLIVETKVKALLIPSETQEKEMKHIDNLTYKTFC